MRYQETALSMNENVTNAVGIGSSTNLRTASEAHCGKGRGVKGEEKAKLGSLSGRKTCAASKATLASAEALPILCVSDFCERERERERDACDVIDITLKSRVIMHMITSTARRPNASTRSEPVERSNFEVHVKTRSVALERSIEQQGRVIDE